MQEGKLFRIQSSFEDDQFSFPQATKKIPSSSRYWLVVWSFTTHIRFQSLRLLTKEDLKDKAKEALADLYDRQVKELYLEEPERVCIKRVEKKDKETIEEIN